MLGARKSLVGIMVVPTVAHGSASQSVALQPVPLPRADRPTVVILNAGIIHRAGPNRVNATLARALASEGFSALRFDLAGIGDSPSRPEALPVTEAALADIREVLDDLEAAGRTRQGVILVGLCSGAFHALLSAETDPRVVGIVLIDLFLPKTTGYYLRHYAGRMLRLESWLNLVRGRNPIGEAISRRLRLTPGRAPLEARLPALAPDVGDRPLRETFEQAFVTAVGRGTQILALFTAGLERQHNYREQILDAFPRVQFGNQLRLEYFASADHTFTLEAERGRLVHVVTEWARFTVFPTPKACEHA